MKKIILIGFIATALMSACRKTSSPTYTTASTPPADQTTAMITQGRWRITLLKDNGSDKTHDFAAYAFQFYSNGKITASKPGSSVNGNWSAGTDNNERKLTLDFGFTPTFNELNNGWPVQQLTQDSISLKKIDGGDTLNLNFKKL